MVIGGICSRIICNSVHKHYMKFLYVYYTVIKKGSPRLLACLVYMKINSEMIFKSGMN